MKKLFILFLLFFTTDSFASGIASNTGSAPCTNTTLETYSGNSNLQADWAPNEIQLRWYNGNTLLDVQSSANTCIYDSTLTIPSTAPSRIGYTFAGWQVRPQMDFSTIPTDTAGIERWGKGVYNGNDYCWYGALNGEPWVVQCASDNAFEELQQDEWKARFSHGIVYGMHLCSETFGNTIGEIGTPTNTQGQYCWCRATGYKEENSNLIKSPTKTLSWVFRNDYLSFGYCERVCDINCALEVLSSKVFRSKLYTPANN